jgi:hypothetical protein
MSFWNVPDADYHEIPVATPGWQNAPVPGWGINPMRAGPARVGVGYLDSCVRGVGGLGGLGGGGIWEEDAFLPRYMPVGLGVDPESAYKETSWGVVALGGAIGIGLGMLFGYAWWGQGRKLTPNGWRRRQRGKLRGTKRRARLYARNEKRRRRVGPEEGWSTEAWARFQLEKRHRRAKTTPPGGYQMIPPPR